MKTPFATTCDACGETGVQYDVTTIRCTVCGEDVCEQCAVEYDYDLPQRALCYDCATPIQKAQQAAQRARVAPSAETARRWTSTMRDWLLTAHHSPEGFLWDTPVLTACRWAVSDSMGADNAWEKGYVEIAHRLLDEVVKNLEQMRQQEVEVEAVK
jgi:hypothetical protein